MQKFSIKNKYDLEIVGVVEFPKNNAKGTCVIQHGYGGFKEQAHIQIVKNAFLEKSYIVVNFDATNSFGESGGEYKNARQGLHYEDMVCVCDWIMERDWFVRPFALSGHSMGGYSAAKYAQDYLGVVDLVIPISPVVSGELLYEAYKENIPEILKNWRSEGFLTKESKSMPGVIKCKPWEVMEEWQNHDLLLDANLLHMPVLLIVGSEDKSCRGKDIRALYDGIGDFRHTKSKLVEIVGGPHILEMSQI